MSASKTKIPYGCHYLDEEDIQAVVDVLRKGPITQGSVVQEFGKALSSYSGAKYCVPVSSGTAALHLSLAALDIGPGDEVITTPLTFCASANVVLHQGAKVRFVDVDQKTLNLDPSLLNEKVNEHTKAVIPVDFRGHPADLPAIRKIADKHELKVVEDGSHSLGSTYLYDEERYSCGDGAHADLCTFSFHPVKHITTGEGGAILGNDPHLYERLVALCQHGIVRREDIVSEEARIGSWFYEMEELGFNYRLTDFQSALGLSQLKKLNGFKARRRQIVEHYNDEFRNFDELTLPFEDPAADSNFHLYILQVNENKRFDRYGLFTHLQDNGIVPMVHYIPVHLLKFYREKFGYRRGDFPNAERFYDQAISIPLYPSIDDEQVDRVVNEVKRFIRSH